MNLKFFAEPSAMAEWTELSLSLALLLVMGLFLGGFALHQAEHVLGHAVALATNA